MDEVKIQRRYYTEYAEKYNDMHVHERDEHYLALAFLVAILDYFEVKSILDIGSGTGRALLYIKKMRPEIRIAGVEPSKELRKIGYKQGLSDTELVEGDATNLKYSDGEFDLVCEFGVLHHIKHSNIVVSEMLRVAKKAIYISDSNNFGQGSLFSRTIKQLINSLRLWKVVDYIKTGGKGYILSEGDGLAYSYSVFNNYNIVKKHCKNIHVLNTKGSGINPYRSAGHVALLGIKK